MGELCQFGKVWEVSCTSLADAFQLIECQTPGFRKYVIDAQEKGYQVEIVKGKDIIVNPEELLLQNSLQDEDVYVTPVPAGAGDLGKLFAIGFLLMMPAMLAGFQAMGAMGAATAAGGIAGGFAYYGAGAMFSAFGSAFMANLGFLGLLGVNLVLSGLTALLAPGPETDHNPAVDETPGDKIFNGPVNVTKQNVPVPLLYGELIIGGVTISGNYKLDSKYGLESYTNDEIDRSLVNGIPMGRLSLQNRLAGN